VDNYGIYVSTASGTNINLYNVHSYGSNIPDNTATVYDDTVNTSVANGTFSITAVPEPAAWALMLVGIGLAGATLRSESKLALAKARARS